MGFTYRAAVPLAAAAVLTLLSGCSRTQHDWRAAQQAGTAQAYEVFVRRHPDSELAGVARQRITQLTEEASWRQATRANTAAAYQAYLARYPNGAWSQDARIRMESRSLPAQAPPGAGPIAPTGAAPETPSSRVTPAAGNGGRYGVQLGAFSSAAHADTEWKQLSSEFGAELRGLTPRVVPITSSGRRLYRLEAGVASEAAARRLCRQLQQHSRGCLPVPQAAGDRHNLTIRVTAPRRGAAA
ncbi:MAG: SPOR domain-containing protein [Gammaproteobacteria bacterium]|nr:SPOR domain-containing protein [Gammaproteobacteria bacterium]